MSDHEVINAEVTRRDEFIHALRQFAYFLESHPTVEAPRSVVVNVFVHTREAIAQHARAATWEKTYNGAWFYLTKHFNEDLRLDITTERDTVCRKVVTGTRLVEAVPAHTVEDFTWECSDTSLLADGGGK